MKNKSILQVLSPTIFKCLDTSFHNYAIKCLSKHVFDDETHSLKDIVNTIVDDATYTDKVKSAEFEFKQYLDESNIDVTNIPKKKKFIDEKDSIFEQVTLMIISIMAIGGVILPTFGIFFLNLSETQASTIQSLMPVLVAVAMVPLNFYFGSSKGSSTKNKTIDKVLDNTERGE
jgi:hypothetical protein